MKKAKRTPSAGKPKAKRAVAPSAGSPMEVDESLGIVRAL